LAAPNDFHHREAAPFSEAPPALEGENQTTSPGRISSIGPPPALCQAAAGGDDESLAERVRVPGSARARLESYAGALNKRRFGRLKQGIDPDGAREPLCRPLGGRLRANPFDVHFSIPYLSLRFGVIRRSLGFCFRPVNEYMVGNAIPGVVDADEKQQQSRTSNAKQGLARVRGSRE